MSKTKQVLTVRKGSSARAEAYRRLGVKPQQVARVANIGSVLHRLPHDSEIAAGDFVIQVLRSSSDPIAEQFLAAYDAIAPYYQKQLPLEAFCVASGVDPSDLLGIIVASAHKHSVAIGNLIAAIHHPDIVQTSVDIAKTPKGVADRMALLKHAGFLPLPKGSQVNVQVNAQAQANSQSASIAAPPPEDTIRRLNDRFNQDRMLPEPIEDTEHFADKDLLPDESA